MNLKRANHWVYGRIMPAIASLFVWAVFFTGCSAHAATTPKVVFIGDNITLDWGSAFYANPNWINKGVLPSSYPEAGTAQETLARFQSDVVALHPNIVHIMVGLDDADVTDDATWRYFGQQFLSSLQSMVQEARAANIQVVLGLEPVTAAYGGSLQQINNLIFVYGAMNNIPVINYGDALCQCVGSSGAANTTYGFVIGPTPFMAGAGVGLGQLPTAIGYQVMTQMAEAAIATLNTRLLGGYLQNVQQENSNEGTPLSPNPPAGNVNTVGPASVLQFTPFGAYTGGLVEPITNTNLVGSNGTWTSSNPLVVSVNQQGMATSLTPGVATITYVSPTGVHFSPWVMHVNVN